MGEHLEDLLEIHAVLHFTRKELQALKELGQRLALEGKPITTTISDRKASVPSARKWIEDLRACVGVQTSYAGSSGMRDSP